MDGLASLREIPSQNFSILHGFEKTFLCASFSYHFPHLKAPSDRKGTGMQGYCLPTFLMEKGKPYGNTNVSLSPGRCKEEIMTIHIAIRKDRCLFSQLFERSRRSSAFRRRSRMRCLLFHRLCGVSAYCVCSSLEESPAAMERKSAFWFSLR